MMTNPQTPAAPFQFAPHLGGQFQLSLDVQGEVWAVRCSGILDAANAASIVQPELLRFHQAVIDRGIRRVELAVQDVEYMNSSGLKSFMAWFLTAANAGERAYTIDVSFHPGRSWQHLSLRPMERLAPKTVRLRPFGG